MIPEQIRERVSSRLAKEVGFRLDVGIFLLYFCSLESDRDVEYALEKLEESDDDVFKKGVSIVLEEVAANHSQIKQRL